MKDFEEIKNSGKLTFKYISSIRLYIRVEENGVRIRNNASGSFKLNLDTIKSLQSLNESARIDAIRKIVPKHYRTVTGRLVEYIIKNGSVENDN